MYRKTAGEVQRECFWHFFFWYVLLLLDYCCATDENIKGAKNATHVSAATVSPHVSLRQFAASWMVNISCITPPVYSYHYEVHLILVPSSYDDEYATLSTAASIIVMQRRNMLLVQHYSSSCTAAVRGTRVYEKQSKVREHPEPRPLYCCTQQRRYRVQQYEYTQVVSACSAQ